MDPILSGDISEYFQRRNEKLAQIDDIRPIIRQCSASIETIKRVSRGRDRSTLLSLAYLHVAGVLLDRSFFVLMTSPETQVTMQLNEALAGAFPTNQSALRCACPGKQAVNLMQERDMPMILHLIDNDKAADIINYLASQSGRPRYGLICVAAPPFSAIFRHKVYADLIIIARDSSDQDERTPTASLSPMLPPHPMARSQPLASQVGSPNPVFRDDIIEKLLASPESLGPPDIIGFMSYAHSILNTGCGEVGISSVSAICEILTGTTSPVQVAKRVSRSQPPGKARPLSKAKRSQMALDALRQMSRDAGGGPLPAEAMIDTISRATDTSRMEAEKMIYSLNAQGYLFQAGAAAFRVAGE